MVGEKYREAQERGSLMRTETRVQVEKLKKARQVREEKQSLREREMVCWSEVGQRDGETLEPDREACDHGCSEHNYLLFKSFSDTAGVRRTLKLERQALAFKPQT